MLRSKVVGKVVFISSVAVVSEDKCEKNKKEKKLIRPSDLPIYSPDTATISTCLPEKKSKTTQAIEDVISTWRKNVGAVVIECEAYGRVGQEYFKQGVDNAEGALTYLRRENNTAPKAGAIIIGGLAGYILGLRRGYFRRSVYTLSGALGMTAICYPRQTSEYSRLASEEGTKFINIAYNFIYGVKKGDPPLQLPSLPQFPKTFQEAWNTVSRTTTSFFSDSTQESKCKKDYSDEDDDDTEVTCHCFDDYNESDEPPKQCPWNPDT